MGCESGVGWLNTLQEIEPHTIIGRGSMRDKTMRECNRQPLRLLTSPPNGVGGMIEIIVSYYIWEVGSG